MKTDCQRMKRIDYNKIPAGAHVFDVALGTLFGMPTFHIKMSGIRSHVSANTNPEKWQVMTEMLDSATHMEDPH